MTDTLTTTDETPTDDTPTDVALRPVSSAARVGVRPHTDWA